MKNLDPDEVAQLLAQIEGEVTVHFRWASVGGVDARLCHPFPVNKIADTKLSGVSNRLLFHNGTWADWRRALTHVFGEDWKIGLHGPMSDSRAMALLVHELKTSSILENVGGRVVIFGSKRTEFFGPWKMWKGMHCSNLGFTYELERGTKKTKANAQAPETEHQLCLFDGSQKKSV
jgi:hypothetical protein